MKKIILTFIYLLAFTGVANSMPVYTDDIPLEHIKKVNEINKTTEENESQSNEEKPSYSEENKVQLYTNEKITVKNIKMNLDYQYERNYKVGDTIHLLVANDVIKNGKVFIKKDTPTKGIFTKVESFNMADAKVIPELKVEGFSTVDVNGQIVKLQGNIHYTSKINFITWALVGYMFSPAKIEKNKIYTLYYK